MKQLIFLGSNHNIHWVKDVAVSAGFQFAGIIDDDYHGQGHFQDIPIIAREQELIDNPEHWKQYQFFCATNWQPAEVRDRYQERNQHKRRRLIDLIEQQGFDVATIVSPRAAICSYNVKIGRGVFIDNFVVVSGNVSIDDWTTIYSFAFVGDESNIGSNCVVQRRVGVTGGVTLGNNVYVAIGSIINKNGITIADDTFIQQGIMVLRDTKPNEVIGLQGKDLRRIYKLPEE
jgi:UDP-3-O-[3-hydroxymyristoyl] glucosamine N-acyltransferase